MARKTAHMTSGGEHRRSSSLKMRSANPAIIAVAYDWDFLHGNHLGGAVPAVFLLRECVHFDLLDEIAAVARVVVIAEM